MGLVQRGAKNQIKVSVRRDLGIFLSLYLTRLFCTAILLISMYLLISIFGTGDSFHLLLEKVGFSLGGRALSWTFRLLGCSAGLALTVGFALRCLLTGEDWGAHMMLPSGEGTSSSAEGSVQPPAPAPESLQPSDPFSYTPLIPDENRWQELNDRLGINSIARPIDLEVRDKIVDTQVLIEKKIEKALLSDRYSPQEILRERHKIRANLFYPHGAPLSMRTYQQYHNLMEKHGTHRTGPYCRLAEAIYQGDISLGEDRFSLYKKRRFF